MLEVLIYLFENYMLNAESRQPKQSQLAKELTGVGFDNEEIDKAILWLNGLLDVCEQDELQRKEYQHAESIRIYTDFEMKQLGIEGQSLLNRLVDVGVLDLFSRELVIDRVMALDSHHVNLDHIKWVVLIVLGNQPDFTEIAEWAELVVSDITPVAH